MARPADSHGPRQEAKTDKLPRMQRCSKSMPIIKIVHVDTPTHVRIDVANFRALVQDMTGNAVVSSDSASIAESWSGRAEFSEFSPNPKLKTNAASHHETRGKHRMTRMRSTTTRPPLSLQHARGRQKARWAITISAGNASIRQSFPETILPRALENIKREASEDFHDCPADHYELNNEYESLRTLACKRSNDSRLETAEGAASGAAGNSVDSFFADDDECDDAGSLQDKDTWGGMAGRYRSSGSGGSNISSTFCAAYKSYPSTHSCSWRATYEMPGGFDYFSF